MNNLTKLASIIATSVLLTACSATPSTSNDHNRASSNMPATHDISSSNISSSNTSAPKQTIILQQSQQIQSYLSQQQYVNITPYIHPTKGVRFSMYAYVQPGSDKVFSQAQFQTYLEQSRIKFTWGQKDGSGELYITSLPDYLSNWVNAADFNNINATYNSFQGSGNSLNNLTEVYANADFVEFYNLGMNPQYQGMDWRALRLVFEAYQGQYYLVAIINDQWTV